MSETGKQELRESILRSASGRDAVTAAPLIAAAPLGILPQTSLSHTMTSSLGGIDMSGKPCEVLTNLLYFR